MNRYQKFTFSTAIRDNTEKEPPSDGVEFRVLVGPASWPAGSPEPEMKEIFRRFTKSKTWEPAEVDLSPFVGEAVRLRLWTGPGPANNTVCDSGYWGNPVIAAGGTQAAPQSDATLRLPWLLIRSSLPGRVADWSPRSDAGTG